MSGQPITCTTSNDENIPKGTWAIWNVTVTTRYRAHILSDCAIPGTHFASRSGFRDGSDSVIECTCNS